jgi:predicted RNase H-like HicB family nuclease
LGIWYLFSMAKREFTAIYQKRGKWVVAWVEEIPGVNAQGRTKREARENLREALGLILQENRKLAAHGAGGDVRREPLRVPVAA